jgi:hypothetical protein
MAGRKRQGAQTRLILQQMEKRTELEKPRIKSPGIEASAASSDASGDGGSRGPFYFSPEDEFEDSRQAFDDEPEDSDGEAASDSKKPPNPKVDSFVSLSGGSERKLLGRTSAVSSFAARGDVGSAPSSFVSTRLSQRRKTSRTAKASESGSSS